MKVVLIENYECSYGERTGHSSPDINLNLAFDLLADTYKLRTTLSVTHLSA